MKYLVTAIMLLSVSFGSVSSELDSHYTLPTEPYNPRGLEYTPKKFQVKLDHMVFKIRGNKFQLETDDWKFQLRVKKNKVKATIKIRF